MGVDLRQHLRRLERFGYIIDTASSETAILLSVSASCVDQDYRDVAGPGAAFSRRQATKPFRPGIITSSRIRSGGEFSPPHPFLPILRHKHTRKPWASRQSTITARLAGVSSTIRIAAEAAGASGPP